MKEALKIVLENFGFDPSSVNIETHGNGLINRTWIISTSTEKYILQRINDSIFNPVDLEFNLKKIIDYLKAYHPGYQTIQPLPVLNKLTFSFPEGSFRMFNYVEDSYSKDVVDTPQLAYETAGQFAEFANRLTGLSPEQLRITIPHFHDLLFRYNQFREALINGDPQRIKESAQIIKRIKEYQYIVETFQNILKKNLFTKRIMHHDTKISNILFSKNGKGLCVIDLDTVMPGYFISDVGDMIRSYASPANEEENDLDKIEVRPEYLAAIKDGYFSIMGNSLTSVEKNHFLYAGRFMIYMQALRFLTDHLTLDVYYGAKYEGHNLIRATNQLRLLELLNEQG